MTIKKPVAVFVIVIVVGITAGIGYGVWSMVERKTFEKSKVIMGDMWNRYDFSSSKLEQYQAIGQVSNPDLRAQQQLRLASVYDFTGEYQKGVPLIKEVIADQVVSSNVRALAIGYLFLAYATERDKNVAQFIFKDGGMYGEALGNGDINNVADLSRAMNNLFAKADSWHETSFIKYLQAFQATGDLLDTKNLTATQKQSDMQAIASYVAAGDALLVQETKERDYANSLSRQLYMHGQHFRLFNLTVLARFDESIQPTVDEAYHDAMVLYARYRGQGIDSFRSLENYTRFYYAAYLADVFGAARMADIQEILEPTIAKDGVQQKANALGIWKFYENELTREPSERNHNERFILSVAKYDPAFNAFLVANGWK